MATALWTCDDELFTLARAELYTAVVGDIMDTLNLRRQFLPPAIRPLRDDMVVVGRAMTVQTGDCVEGGDDDPFPGKPFGVMLEALDDLKPGEVYVCAGASPTYALWGELMSARAMALGAAGAIVDGYSRDTRGILALGFPTFSYGPYAQDQAPRGKVRDFRVSLDVRGTRVDSGDVVFGDIDGVCVVPRAAVEDVFTQAIAKARGERTVLKAIQSGMGAADAFARYGIM